MNHRIRQRRRKIIGSPVEVKTVRQGQRIESTFLFWGWNLFVRLVHTWVLPLIRSEKESCILIRTPSTIRSHTSHISCACILQLFRLDTCTWGIYLRCQFFRYPYLPKGTPSHQFGNTELPRAKLNDTVRIYCRCKQHIEFWVGTSWALICR